MSVLPNTAAGADSSVRLPVQRPGRRLSPLRDRNWQHNVQLERAEAGGGRPPCHSPARRAQRAVQLLTAKLGLERIVPWILAWFNKFGLSRLLSAALWLNNNNIN